MIIIGLFLIFTEQKYVPLRSSDITNEIGQSTAGTHQLTISWNEQDNSNGYIVAIGDERCTTMNRNPPCKFVKNHVSLYLVIHT